MSENVTKALRDIVRFASTLPSNPAAYAAFTATMRRKTRSALETTIVRLNEVSDALNTVRQPQHLFDPTDPKVIGKVVADTLLLHDREMLTEAVNQQFCGAGVYAI